MKDPTPTINVTHAEMDERLEEWILESGYAELDPEILDCLVDAFKAGHAACMDVAMSPAVTLAILMLKIIKVQRHNKEIVFHKQFLDQLQPLCRQIVGDIPDEQLGTLYGADNSSN